MNSLRVQSLAVALVGALVFLVATVSGVQSQSAQPTTQSSAPTHAAVISLSGFVDDYMDHRLRRTVEAARAQGAKTIILELDTYGGLSTAGLNMSRYIKGLRDVQTIAYVNDKAISAGTMIALACDQIVMAPSAVIGDCAPIAMTSTGQLQPLPPTERGKFESPIAADFFDSATRRGYDPLLVDSMITVGYTVYWIENDGGQRRFVTEKQYQELQGAGQWHLVSVAGVRNPVVGQNRLLTTHTPEAAKLGLASGIAASETELASQRNLSILARYETPVGETFIQLLTNQYIRGLLVTVFLMSLYAAFHAPGHGAAEAVAVLSLSLLLGVPLLAGYATWWEIIAILAGIGLLALELFVIPGFGVAGVAGIVLVVGGFILTFVGQEPGGLPGFLPKLQGTWDALLRGLYVVTGGLICSMLLSIWLRRYLPKLPYFNRLILTTVTGDIAPGQIPGTVAAAEDTWPFLGTTGKAVSELKPGGVAEFPYGDDKRVTAVVSDGGYVAPGTAVKVREISGNRIVVRPVVG